MVDALIGLVYDRFLDICGYWIIPSSSLALLHVGIHGSGRRNGLVHSGCYVADLRSTDGNDLAGRKHDTPDCNRHDAHNVRRDVADMDSRHWYYKDHASVSYTHLTLPTILLV